MIEDAAIKALRDKLAKLDEDRATLVRAIQLMEPGQPTLRFEDQEEGPSFGRRIRAVRDIIRKIDGRFYPINIRDHLKANNPDLFKTFKENTISGLFHTLVENKEIERVANKDNGRAYYVRTTKLR